MRERPCGEGRNSRAVRADFQDDDEGAIVNLSAHFTLEELTFSEAAVRHGYSNEPSEEILPHLRALAAALEMVRYRLGHPVLISSGYRSIQVNAAIGGSRSSAHMRGLAADFRCPNFGEPLKVAAEIATIPFDFDQIIHEFDRWVHLGIAASGETGRRQLLTIDRAGTRTGLLPARY